MLKNLVFDMGGVLIDWIPEKIMEFAGITDKADVELILKNMYKTSDWALMDWGYIDEAGLEALVRERVPERLWGSIHHLLYNWPERFLPVSGMADLIRDYKKKGLNIYLVSNASKLLNDYFPHLPGSEYFTDYVVSANVKMVKPMHEIFEYALSKFGIKAEESLFIDDLFQNIAGARVCGMHGYVFNHDPEKLRAHIESLLAGEEDKTGYPMV